MDYVLTHHGIIGMKWGKRNGPPYPIMTGRKGIGKTDPNKHAGDKQEKGNEVKSRNRSVKDMSDEELKDAIFRLELERKYSDLLKPERKEKLFNGKKFVSEILTVSGKSVAIQTSHYLMGAGVNKLFSKVSGGENIVDKKNIIRDNKKK